MSREILFRAKRADNGEWVEGCLLISDERYFIIPEFGVSCIEEVKYRTTDKLITLYAFEVDPETVCQYTGLTDKNGKKIFEGDIIKEKTTVGIVKFGKCGNGFHYGFYIEWLTCPHLRPELAFWDSEIQVTGNIFDNPELLEVEE